MPFGSRPVAKQSPLGMRGVSMDTTKVETEVALKSVPGSDRSGHRETNPSGVALHSLPGLIFMLFVRRALRFRRGPEPLIFLLSRMDNA